MAPEMTTAGETIADSPPRARRRALATLGILIVLQLPIAGWLFFGDGLTAQCEREGVYWAMLVFVLGYVAFVERRTLASVGWRRPNWKSGAFALLAAIIMLGGMAMIYLYVLPLLGASAEEAPMTAMKQAPRWLLFAIVIRAAIFEETFYRGFAIERLTEMTGRRSVAAFLSWAAFTLAHLSGWGAPHLLIAGFGGLVLTILYIRRRDLASNMLAHFLTDAVGFLL